MLLASPLFPVAKTRFQPILDELEMHIGCPFSVCGDVSGESEITAGWSEESLAVATSEARTQGQSVVRISGDLHGICLRLPGSIQRRSFAIGTFRTADRMLLVRLARTARLLVEQENVNVDQSANIDSFMEMLSYGLEEQVWLRSLAQHIKLCSARRSLIDVVGELLPALKQLVSAESIGFVRSTVTEASDESSLWRGRNRGTEVVWRQWIGEFPHENNARPIVQNGTAIIPELSVEGITAICAVHVGHSGIDYGWLVAAKSAGHFGTVEAGLMEAATVMLATHGQNVDLLRDREDLIVGIIRAIAGVVDARDPYTRGHSERVGRYGRRLAVQAGLLSTECDRIYLAGLLHDVGKIGIPDAVLCKPGRLTDEEFDVIKMHPEIGARIVSPLPQLADLLPGILHHHESVDGNGYPFRLEGDTIPMMARILAVADTYDALTSNRTYRQGKSHEAAIEVLRERAGIQWDAELVGAFLAIPEVELRAIAALNRGTATKTNDQWLRGGAESICDETRVR